MKKSKTIELTVYYDGLCILCSTEINHYQRQSGADKIEFIDITKADFNAQAEGVDPYKVHQIMHVKTASGDIITKVNAFIEIWKLLPKYNKLAHLAKNSIVRSALDFGYNLFVKARPYLPRRKQLCENSPYCNANNEK